MLYIYVVLIDWNILDRFYFNFFKFLREYYILLLCINCLKRILLRNWLWCWNVFIFSIVKEDGVFIYSCLDLVKVEFFDFDFILRGVGINF